LGIVYDRKDTVLSPADLSWDILVNTQKNPYWRQRISIPNTPKSQLLLALLATQQELSVQSWFIPEMTVKWFKQLRLEGAPENFPLEMAFLGNKISAAVVFSSQFFRLKKVVPDLQFIVPYPRTYFDRIGIAWSSHSVQDNLAKSFIAFVEKNKEDIVKSSYLLSLKTTEFQKTSTQNWVLYEDDIPLPKRIESILKDLSTL
jgi:hypothetical protein